MPFTIPWATVKNPCARSKPILPSECSTSTIASSGACTQAGRLSLIFFISSKPRSIEASILFFIFPASCRAIFNPSTAFFCNASIPLRNSLAACKAREAILWAAQSPAIFGPTHIHWFALVVIQNLKSQAGRLLYHLWVLCISLSKEFTFC